ncbi:MAG: hypothetical protein R3B09_11170 [Nannocystaceae bacterium]
MPTVSVPVIVIVADIDMSVVDPWVVVVPIVVPTVSLPDEVVAESLFDPPIVVVPAVADIVPVALASVAAVDATVALTLPVAESEASPVVESPQDPRKPTMIRV